MIVQLTTQGAAKIDANRGPIELGVFKLGSAFNYVPTPGDTNIHGTQVFQGQITPYGVVNPNVVKYSAIMDATVGDFDYGEIGLYATDGTLFALGVSQELLHKLHTTGQQAGNSVRIDIYLSMVDGNYDMWFDVSESNNPFRIATLATVDQLPPSANAVPNTYIITGASSDQSSFLAYTDRSGLWNFDAYAFANQTSLQILSHTSTSVTVDSTTVRPDFAPAYFGQIIIEFSAGADYSICRYVTAVVFGPTTTTFSFGTPLAQVPNVGDTFILFSRQQLSTTIENLPIATRTKLGGIKVGNSLNITVDGVLDVNPASFPVTSVNGLTGNVVLDATNITGFATVAYTGKYTDLIGAPGQYFLPIATTTRLGGVMAPTSGNIVVGGTGIIDLGFAPVKTVNGNNPDVNGNVVIDIKGAVIGLVYPTELTTGTDLNTVKNSGLYFANQAEAQSLLNGPDLAANRTELTLEVIPFSVDGTSGDVIQRLTERTTMFYRMLQGTVWSQWTVISTGGAIPIASTVNLGGVIVGAGLNVTSNGVLSTQIQSVNGHSDQNIVLTALDVGAVDVSAVGQPNGVARLTLDTSATINNARVPFYETPLGVWFTAGKWDASQNQILQSYLNRTVTTVDPNTSLASAGKATIDISYGGNNPNALAVPTYQLVYQEGAVYDVIVGGNTTLDGVSNWAVGDMAIAVNGTWRKFVGPNGVFSAGTF